MTNFQTRNNAAETTRFPKPEVHNISSSTEAVVAECHPSSFGSEMEALMNSFHQQISPTLAYIMVTPHRPRCPGKYDASLLAFKVTGPK